MDLEGCKVMMGRPAGAVDGPAARACCGRSRLRPISVHNVDSCSGALPRNRASPSRCNRDSVENSGALVFADSRANSHQCCKNYGEFNQVSEIYKNDSAICYLFRFLTCCSVCSLSRRHHHFGFRIILTSI